MDFLYVLPLIIMFVLMILRVPVGLSIFCACIVYFIVAGKSLGLIASLVMSNAYSNSTFVAIPLFIFMANIMNSGKVTEYMYTFAKSIIGKKRGATAYMNIMVSLIFSGMTGSAMADACGTGIMEVEEMKKDGYDGPFSCALTVATAIVGPIFPPSIPLVIYAMVAEVSVGKLFMGGMIPAVLICIVLGVYVWYISKKRNYPYGVHFTTKEFLTYTWKAFPALLTPVILLGGMYSGIVTPTEGGVLASLYAIIISLTVYKCIDFKGIIKAVKDSVLQTGVILVIAGAAWVLSYVVSMTGIGSIIADWFLGITTEKYAFLLIVNIVFLLMGMFFDTTVLLLVFVPLFIPAATALGIDLVHFGVILVVNIMIGLATPPYGAMCFAVSGLTKEPLGKIFKEIIPLAACLVIVLLLITYIPDLVMLIPNLFS